MPNFKDRVLAAVQPELDEIRGLFAASTEVIEPQSGGGSPIDPECCEEVLKTVKEIKRKIDECCRNMEPDPPSDTRDKDNDWLRKIYDLIDQFKQMYDDFKKKSWELEDEIDKYRLTPNNTPKANPQIPFIEDTPGIPAPIPAPVVPLPAQPALPMLMSYDVGMGSVLARLDDIDDPLIGIRVHQIYRNLLALSNSMAECCSTMQNLIRGIDTSDKTDYTRIQDMIDTQSSGLASTLSDIIKENVWRYS